MPNGVALRQNIDALSRPELEALRSAYARLMRIFDNVVDGEVVQGYNWLAGLHGLAGWYCWHEDLPLGPGTNGTGVNGNLFLPWHRAYILYFELSLRDIDPTVALPWWDWRNLNSVPQAFSEETVNGEPNPLYKAHISVPNVEDRDTRRFPGQRVPPTLMPTPEEVDALYSIPDFVQFSRALQRIHNRIHGWTGGETEERVPGDMALQDTAAYDPIFWSHHSMVDRVWYIWQLKNGINNIPAEYLSAILAPFRLTVRDVLNIGKLGYEYVVSGYTVEA
jgi:tyrosinase